MSLSNYDPGKDLSSTNFSGMIGGPLTAAVEAQAQSALATIDIVKGIGFTPDIVDDTTGEITPGSPVYVTFKYPKLLAPYVPAVSGIVETANVNTGGIDYVVGDTVELGTGGAAATIDSVNSGGEITGFTIISGGSGYTANQIVDVIGGSGNGGKVDISTTTDTPQEPADFEDMVLEVPIITMMPIPYLRVDHVEIDFHAKITSMEYKNVAKKFDFSKGFSTSKSKKLTIKDILSITRSVNLKLNFSAQKSDKEGHKIDKTYQLGVKVRASQDEMPGGMESILGILEEAIVSQPEEA